MNITACECQIANPVGDEWTAQATFSKLPETKRREMWWKVLLYILICIKGLTAQMFSVLHSQPFFRVAGLSFPLCWFDCLFLCLSFGFREFKLTTTAWQRVPWLCSCVLILCLFFAILYETKSWNYHILSILADVNYEGQFLFLFFFLVLTLSYKFSLG